MKKITAWFKQNSPSLANRPKLVFGVAPRRRPSWQQFRYFPLLLGSRQQLLYRACLFAAGLSLIFLIGAYYFLNTQVVPKPGGEYSEGLIGYPEYINPILASANDVDLDLSRLIYSSLFKYDSQQNLQPDLVTNYLLSDDQKTYTLYLRSDARWHDGETVTAADVIFTIQAIQDKEYKSPLRQSLLGVQVEKLDDYSLKLTLAEPFAPFLSSLTFGILPQHRWFDIPAVNFNLAEDNLKPIGSGPFRFASLIKDKSGLIKSYHLIKSENYYGQHPYLDKLHFTFYPDSAAALADLGQKKIDGLAFIPTSQKESLSHKNKKLSYSSLRLPQYTALFFNQKRSDVLSKEEVRQALVWGVDRQRIINEVLAGDGDIIYTPILPGFVGYNPEVEKYGFDINKGKEILEAAGWSIPADQPYYYKNDQILEFTISTMDQPEYQKTLEILKENWGKMGVKINVDIYAPEDIQQQIIKPRSYEALLFGEIIGTDPDPYPFWHSSQMTAPGLALAIFYQKDVDNLLETARQTNNNEDRRLKYLNFQNILAADLPAIFLFNPRYAYAVDKKIKGINSEQYITTPADRFSGIADWHIKTERVWK